jgi:hypothetical protein
MRRNLAGTDASLLSVNSSGVVILTSNPDYETKPSYSFTVTASDAAATSASTTVTSSITNVDEVIPTITSGTTGTNLVENSGAGQTIYTITADANGGGTIVSYAIAGTDASLLSVNSSGVVTLNANPDYETKNSYSFTVTASDAAATSAATTVTFSILIIEVGDFYQGGVVFYIFVPGDTGYVSNETHGLIAAVADQSSPIQWYNGSYVTTGATATAIGTGSANTAAIISVQGATQTSYAAGLARAYTAGGYADWFLPSKDELNKIYQNQSTINTTALANGGSSFANDYWSSTEYDNLDAWFHYFNNGYQNYISKNNANNVRAVRAF